MQGKKISFTVHNFKFKYVRQKESPTSTLNSELLLQILELSLT